MHLLLFLLASLRIPDLIEADKCNVCDPTCRWVDCYRGPVHGNPWPGKKRETATEEDGVVAVEKAAPVKREVAVEDAVVQKRDKCNVCDPTCRWVDCYRGPVHGGPWKKREAEGDAVEKRNAQGETYPSCICRYSQCTMCSYLEDGHQFCRQVPSCYTGGYPGYGGKREALLRAVEKRQADAMPCKLESNYGLSPPHR